MATTETQLNKLKLIDSLHMAVSVDDDGTEGLCAVLANGVWTPLLAADAERLPFILEWAERIAKQQQRIVRIVKLTGRVDIRRFDGRL